MNAIRKAFVLLKSIARDTRGEDLAEVSSGISRSGKVAIVAVSIAAAAAGATTLANNANSAGDHTSQQVNGAVNANAGTTQQASSPFKVQ